MIRDVGESVSGALVETVGRAVGRAQEKRSLPADLLESEEAFLAVFDAPGAQSTDIQVRFEDGTVLARIDRFRESQESYEMQFPGRGLSLDGRLDLPETANVAPEAATATLRDNGTLEIRLPKVKSESETEHADSEGSDDGTENAETTDDGTDGTADDGTDSV